MRGSERRSDAFVPSPCQVAGKTHDMEGFLFEFMMTRGGERGEQESSREGELLRRGSDGAEGG